MFSNLFIKIGMRFWMQFDNQKVFLTSINNTLFVGQVQRLE